MILLKYHPKIMMIIRTILIKIEKIIKKIKDLFMFIINKIEIKFLKMILIYLKKKFLLLLENNGKNYPKKSYFLYEFFTNLRK